MNSSKIPCGGFYIDPAYLYFAKDENGKPIMSIIHEALVGIQGPKGDKGDPFSITKIYKTIEEMEADYDNEEVPIDSFVIIENTVHTEDNGKLYIKDVDGFDYITDLSTGVMIEGPKGNDGVGVPTGGHSDYLLVKSSDEDFATHWQDLSANLLPTVTEEEDNGKIMQVVDGEWQSTFLEHGQIIYTESTMQVGQYNVPVLTEAQTNTIYNSFVAGKSVVISNAAGTKHYSVISVDASDTSNIKAKILFEDKLILTYNKFGRVEDYTTINDGEVVTYSREFATAPNDHGYVREWKPNAQGKVWVECGVFITTVALSVGSNVPLPVTFEDENFHVQVTVLELGNYAATAYRSGNKRSINVRVHDYYGTPKAVKICVETKGWKQI